MKATTKNNVLVFTEKPSFGLLVDEQKGNDKVVLRSFAKIIAARLTAERDSAKLAVTLAELARQLLLLHDPHNARLTGGLITELPLHPSVTCIGTYYSKLAESNGVEGPREVLARIADDAAPGLRERVILQYARSYLRAGDLGSATYYYLEATRASARTDLLSNLQAHRLLAVCRSSSGDHTGALSDLSKLWGPMQCIKQHCPAEYLQYRNSIAVELGHVGRIDEAKSIVTTLLASSFAPRFPNWLETKRELDEIEAKGAKCPPLVFAIGSVFEPASQLEEESRAEASIGTRPDPAPETVRAQEAEPLAQPRPAHNRAIATSYKREAIPLAAIPLVIAFQRPSAPLAGTSEKCSTRRRPRAGHDFWRDIKGKPARAPPSRVLFLD